MLVADSFENYVNLMDSQRNEDGLFPTEKKFGIDS